MSFLEGVDVRRPGRVADLLARAMRQRAVGATATNEHSSRSHMVFTLAIAGTNAASGQEVHGELRGCCVLLCCVSFGQPVLHCRCQAAAVHAGLACLKTCSLASAAGWTMSVLVCGFSHEGICIRTELACELHACMVNTLHAPRTGDCFLLLK